MTSSISDSIREPAVLDKLSMVVILELVQTAMASGAEVYKYIGSITDPQDL